MKTLTLRNSLKEKGRTNLSMYLPLSSVETSLALSLDEEPETTTRCLPLLRSVLTQRLYSGMF
ncbi:MAG: hypothetical protein AT713_02280 [Caldivirga sp. JCHS_4]|nr:MAG: hypothetical protein AT713_02280 [Caldivirga sp. JCHS_4]